MSSPPQLVNWGLAAGTEPSGMPCCDGQLHGGTSIAALPTEGIQLSRVSPLTKHCSSRSSPCAGRTQSTVRCSRRARMTKWRRRAGTSGDSGVQHRSSEQVSQDCGQMGFEHQGPTLQPFWATRTFCRGAGDANGAGCWGAGD